MFRLENCSDLKKIQTRKLFKNKIVEILEKIWTFQTKEIPNLFKFEN
jgi:hypothetical protein